MNMASHLPSGKVTAAAVAGALGYLFVLVFNQYVPDAYRLGTELASAIPLTAGLVAAYFTQPSAQDVVAVAP